MVVDSSVIAAIFLNEEDAGSFVDQLNSAPSRRISAATLVEIGIVLDQRIAALPDDVDDTLSELLRTLRITVVPFTEAHARLARAAYRRFGRGRHPAKLNFGDCMSYALAKSLDEPLLFKGTDFTQTDIRLV
jgi:ribonuclease VapC